MKILAFLCILLTGCQLSAPPTPPVVQQVLSSPATRSPTSRPLSDLSVYNLGAEWKDQQGRARHLADLRGKVVLVAMVYTSCQATCPYIIDDMKKIQAASSPELEMVLVSFDPEVDTPEVLAAFARERKLGERWTLFQGTPDSVQELSAVIGLRYRKTTGNQYAHSNLISVLNREGEIVHQQEGVGANPRESLRAIQDSLRSKP